MLATSTARDSVAAATMYSPVAATTAARNEKALRASALAPAAGGAGSLRMDRGKKPLTKPGGGEPLQLGPGGPASAAEYPVRTVRRTVRAVAAPSRAVHARGMASLQLRFACCMHLDCRPQNL